MQVSFADLSAQHLPLHDRLHQALQNLLENGKFIGGEPVAQFEQDFAAYISTAHGVACGNGTDALEIVLRALDIGLGDEVIVPANGWLSAAEAVCLVGATPVFVDNDADTYNIDTSLIENCLTPRTRAIIPVHLYGLPADMPRIMALAQQHDLRVIEDCAQAPGARIGDRKVGGWGDAAIFSFYPIKNIGAIGDAGMMLTNDPTLAQRLRCLANYGRFEKDAPTMLGRNSRMDPLQAAFLSIKLPYLDQWNQQRQDIAQQYREALADTEVILPGLYTDKTSVYHLLVVQVAQRERVQQYLEQQGIATEVHYPYLVCTLPLFRRQHQPARHFPVATRQASRLLSLPLYPGLTSEAVAYVAYQLKAFYGLKPSFDSLTNYTR